MKTIYEITRPIIANISIDGDLAIPISYAYDLYKAEIVAQFDHGEILAQWRTLVETANRDTFVRTYFDQLINQGWARIENLAPSFWENLQRSNLELIHRQSRSAEFGDTLFEELFGKPNIMRDEHNDQLFAVTSWYGYVIDLVHNLEDTTNTFGAEDVDFFAANVNDLLAVLNWRNRIAERLS